MQPSFKPLGEGTGVEIVDPIERRRYALRTATAVRPTPIDGDAFSIPVDATAAITTTALSSRQMVDVYVRDLDDGTVTEIHPPGETALPEGTYRIELNAPIKLYLRMTGACTITVDADRMQFAFDSETEVLIGARSYHQRPAATITTTSAPEDVMTALSYLGSALKTTSCERSYPTLRGHPPMIELGDELHIPDELRRPETGVRLELPAKYRAMYVAAPLAYYLGADVVPGSTPRLVTRHGFEHELDTARGFEDEVERVLKQVLFLDCLTRTEGYYPVDLHERRAIEPLVDLDFERLYGLSIGRQIEAYLDVPFDVVSEHVPQWRLTAYVAPAPEYVEALPFAVNELAVVRPAKAPQVSASEIQSHVLDEYLRGGAGGSNPRSSDRDGSAGDAPTMVRPEVTDSLEHAWFGEDVPLGASKTTVRAFRNKLDQAPKEGAIDITVVCNDSEMSEEYDVVDDLYGTRDELPFDATLRRNLSVADLRDVLASGTNFFHYIGHIDGRGFRCRDGFLDATTIETVDVGAFLLNACQSYEQGMGLIEAGAIGGVVTFSDVINSGAVRIGCTMARLLNLGFPLGAALALTRGESVTGGHYLVVGDGGADIAQVEDGVPTLCELVRVDDVHESSRRAELSDVESNRRLPDHCRTEFCKSQRIEDSPRQPETQSGDGDYDLTIRTYLPREGGIGTMVYPYIDGNECHFLAPGVLGTFRMSKSELWRYLAWHQYPIKIEGELAFGIRDLDRKLRRGEASSMDDADQGP